ncbi:MAG: 50S ribosomal protein P1, partial [Candidatus Thermoplasmatota archaeon]|nr:50S ribosomal protein P1 [Candidatus Thermoplasmatota archaeon]
MEYVYSAMLLHSAGQPINEENVKKVLTAAGVKTDAARVKALVASLEGVNIDEAIKSAAVPVAAAPAAAAAPAEKKEKKKEEKKEEVSQDEAAAGL